MKTIQVSDEQHAEMLELWALERQITDAISQAVNETVNGDHDTESHNRRISELSRRAEQLRISVLFRFRMAMEAELPD